ncbi:MAG TPA: hypothetical protein VF578_10805 [Methylomirabilota bacterium]
MIALLVWAVLVEPGRVVAREVRVPIARWPDGLRPPRIAAIADVHAGAPHMTLDAIGGTVATVNAARPDLIVLLGERDPRPRHEHPAGALPRAARDLAADGGTMTR